MARPSLGESATERLHIKITADEINSIDEWRFLNRIPSKSEAVRRLCQIGLAFEPLVREAIDFAEKVEKAQAASFSEITDAYGSIMFDDRVPEDVKQKVERILTAIDTVGTAVGNLEVHAHTMDVVFYALRAGETVEESAERAKQVIGESTRFLKSLQRKTED